MSHEQRPEVDEEAEILRTERPRHAGLGQEVIRWQLYWRSYPICSLSSSRGRVQLILLGLNIMAGEQQSVVSKTGWRDGGGERKQRHDHILRASRLACFPLVRGRPRPRGLSSKPTCLVDKPESESGED